MVVHAITFLLCVLKIFKDVCLAVPKPRASSRVFSQILLFNSVSELCVYHCHVCDFTFLFFSSVDKVLDICIILCSLSLICG